MTLDQLLVFNTIIEQGSFRKAAETLHRAQSACSFAIKNLEQELGIALFDRSGYRPKLTDSGLSIHVHAVRLLEAADELSLAAKDYSAGNEARMQIAVSALYPIHLLADVLAKFSKRFPYTQVCLEVAVLGAVDELLSSRADIAISEFEDDQMRYDKLNCQRIHTIELAPIVAGSHPLNQATSPVPKSELLRYPQIILPSTSSKSKDKSAGILTGSNTWSVSDFATKKALLMRGLGWGLMPMHLVEQEIASGELTMLQVDGFTKQGVPFHAVRALGRGFQKAGTALWQMLTE